jgi:hypothetical protein
MTSATIKTNKITHKKKRNSSFYYKYKKYKNSFAKDKSNMQLIYYQMDLYYRTNRINCVCLLRIILLVDFIQSNGIDYLE